MVQLTESRTICQQGQSPLMWEKNSKYPSPLKGAPEDHNELRGLYAATPTDDHLRSRWPYE